MFKLIKEISDASLGIGAGISLGEKYELRKSARAVLLNDNGEMATMFLKRDGFHKLPGGGLEAGEDVETALHREVLEETGCRCEIVAPIGVVVEYRNKYKLLQISYAYSARMIGDIGIPKLEDEEIEEGLQVVWLDPQAALTCMKAEQPERYEGNFILTREIAILEEHLRAAK